jgi:hypothetical protein
MDITWWETWSQKTDREKGDLTIAMSLYDEFIERARYGSRYENESREAFDAWLKAHGLTALDVIRAKEEFEKRFGPTRVQRFFHGLGNWIANTIPFALLGAFLAAAGLFRPASYLLILAAVAAVWRIEIAFQQYRKSLEAQSERFAREIFLLREDTRDLLARSEPPSRN